MAHRNWHILREGDALTLARRLPVRFDFAAQTVISGGAGLRRGRIAHQVRQDMWRALQDLRGFAPVVRVLVRGDDLEITAGGAVSGRFPKTQCEAAVAEVLADSVNRARWMRTSAGVAA